MKKVILTLSLLAFVVSAMAQNEVKSIPAAASQLKSAKTAIENPKKNTQPKVWLKYGQALLDAYDAGVGPAWRNANKADLQILLGGEKPLSTEEVSINGQKLTKDSYPIRDLYFNQEGRLVAIEVKSVVEENALEKIFEAVDKTVELDVKKACEKDLVKLLNDTGYRFKDAAIFQYNLGNIEKSSEFFDKTVQAFGKAPLSVIDTMSVYNAGFTANEIGNLEKATANFKKCLELGYYGASGDVFARLGMISLEQKDTVAAKKFYTEGFAKFPQSQLLCVSLINLYVKTGEDSEEIIRLIDKAKANDPSNASLYYVEGNVRKELGQADKAIEAYRKSQEINPKFEWGFIGEGQIYSDRAEAAVKAAAAELDDAKYTKLIEEFEKNYKLCIEPYEKALAITSNPLIKKGLSEQLKAVYYRFSSKDEASKAKYEYYKKLVEDFNK